MKWSMSARKSSWLSKPTVHHQNLQLLLVADLELLEAAGKEVASLGVGAVPRNEVQSGSAGRPAWSSPVMTHPILGIGKLPLNRLLTRLSIPLGFLHDSPTRMKRSDWKRWKRFVRFFTMGIWFSGVGIFCFHEDKMAGKSRRAVQRPASRVQRVGQRSACVH